MWGQGFGPAAGLPAGTELRLPAQGVQLFILTYANCESTLMFAFQLGL
jgi:hypothetical protein